MTKRTRIVVGTGTVLTSILLLGCSRPPHDEVARAQSAFDAASRAESETYAPESFAAARKSLTEALAEVESQKRTPFFSRSYRRAKQMLDRAADRAHQAMAEAEKKREEMRIDSQALIREADLAVTSARKLAEWAEAPSGASNDWNEGVASAAANLSAAKSAFKNGSYLEAHARAEDAKARADEVNEAITRAHTRRRSTASAGRGKDDAHPATERATFRSR